MKRKLVILLFIAIGLRFFALDGSTHFLTDESRDLVNIHQIWVEKKITLVGPISDDRSHVFSSLTYYMLLPFAAAWNFDPLGTVVGAAVWGVFTSIILVWWAAKNNSKMVLWTAVLAAIWWPLLQTSRWPWNPNLLLFWMFLGLVLIQFDSKLARIGAGVAFGLAIHHHYLALIPAVLISIKKRDWLVGAGIIMALIPFIIFDWRHPPGIFISRTIDYNRTSFGQSPMNILVKLPNVFSNFINYIFGPKLISLTGGLSVACLAIWDIWKKSISRGWLIIWLISLIPLTLYSQQFHYLLPTFPFFAVWLLSKRNGLGEMGAKFTIGLLIIGSMINLHMHYESPDWSGDLKLLRGAAEIIRQQVLEQDLKNPNLAVLGSPDIFPAGQRYRDILLVNEIRIKPYEAYETSDNLFVVTKTDEQTLRSDPAAEIMYFRNGPMAGKWEIPNTDWRVIQFNRY